MTSGPVGTIGADSPSGTAEDGTRLVSVTALLAMALAVPFACLGLLIWLARLEDTLLDADDPTVQSAGAASATPEPLRSGGVTNR
jgi:hypothetical protein